MRTTDTAASFRVRRPERPLIASCQRPLLFCKTQNRCLEAVGTLELRRTDVKALLIDFSRCAIFRKKKPSARRRPPQQQRKRRKPSKSRLNFHLWVRNFFMLTEQPFPPRDVVACILTDEPVSRNQSDHQQHVHLDSFLAPLVGRCFLRNEGECAPGLARLSRAACCSACKRDRDACLCRRVLELRGLSPKAHPAVPRGESACIGGVLARRLRPHGQPRGLDSCFLPIASLVLRWSPPLCFARSLCVSWRQAQEEPGWCFGERIAS